LIVGDGPLENAIKQQIAALGLEKHVLLTGSRPDVPALMGGVMDLFVLPSFYEGLGLVLVEAQAAGLPCLCADVIPSEAEVVSPLVTRMSLGRPISEWANAIRSYRGKRPPVDRQRAFEIVQASRFNLHRGNLEELEKIYSRGDNGSSR